MKRLNNIKNSDQLLDYFHEFKNMNEDEFAYDTNLIVHLMLALLDNLEKYMNQGEIDDIGYSFNNKQRKFFAVIAASTNRITDSEIDAEED